MPLWCKYSTPWTASTTIDNFLFHFKFLLIGFCRKSYNDPWAQNSVTRHNAGGIMHIPLHLTTFGCDRLFSSLISIPNWLMTVADISTQKSIFIAIISFFPFDCLKCPL